MPGRDYTEAFARFSPTIPGVFSGSQVADTSCHGTQNDELKQQRVETLPAADATNEGESHFDEVNSPFAMQHPSFDFPPTPPQHITNDSTTPSTVSARTSQNSAKALSGVSTPTNKKDLPTPDITPPRAVPYSNLSSVSFLTAKENPISSMDGADDSRHQSSETIPAQGLVAMPQLGYAIDYPASSARDLEIPFRREPRVSPSLRNRPDVRSLVGHWERESKRYSLADTESWPSSQVRDSTALALQLQLDPLHVADEERKTPDSVIGRAFSDPTWDRENVHTEPDTLEDLHAAVVANPEAASSQNVLSDIVPTADRADTLDSLEPSPLSPTDHDGLHISYQSAEPSPLTPKDHGIRPDSVSALTGSMGLDVPSKDWSDVSPSAPSHKRKITDAIAIDTVRSPPRRPRLRHVAKNLSLREAASDSGGSNRNSMNSDETVTHRLTRKNNILPMQLGIPSMDEMAPSSSRPRTAPETCESPQNSLRRSARLSSNVRESFKSGSDEKRSFSDPLGSRVFPAGSHTTRLSKTGSSEIPIIYEDHPVLERLRHRTGWSDSRISSTVAGTPTIAHFSLDTSSIAAKNLQRLSSDPVKDASTGNTLITYTPTCALNSPVTLHSTLSAHQIGEATTISIYPHTNNSLLMVHNRDSQATETQISAALITLEDRTKGEPQIQPYPERLNSPLTNPRAAPAPPVVTLTSTGPAEALENSTTNQKAIIPMSRVDTKLGPTLVGRARQASGSVLQPFTSTLRGSLDRRKTRERYYHGTGQRRISNGLGSNRYSSLHPFWRPRSFWPDEDSKLARENDSIYDDNNNHNNNEIHDDDIKKNDDNEPVNKSAATDSKYNEAEVQKYNDNPHWRRGKSLRGFLIGNTLGLERGPTNRRRHVVALPSTVRKKKISPRKKATPAPPSPVNGIQKVTVRDSVRRSGSGRAQRSAGQTSLSTFWPFNAWKDMIAHRQERRKMKHEEENL